MLRNNLFPYIILYNHHIVLNIKKTDILLMGMRTNVPIFSNKAGEFPVQCSVHSNNPLLVPKWFLRISSIILESQIMDFFLFFF